MSKHTRTRGEDYQAPAPVPKVQRTRGRPGEYDEEKLRQACLYAKLGATDAEIAEGLGMDVSTIYRWYRQFPEFCEAVNASKDQQNSLVARSLYQRARGYSYKTEKVFSNGFRAEVYEHIPADVGAALNWLYNRDPDRWKKSGEVQIVVPVGDEQGTLLNPRDAALAALALFNEAQYAPAAAGVLLEATANREENDDGIDSGHREQTANADAAEDDWESGVDLDPGEL